MTEVDILLASYNGESFIAEQIDSILNQTFQNFRLVIRDDGSSDKTPEIIESYARKYPDKVEVVHDDVTCKNPTKNFFQLVKHAKADYVMFSDQDDYWQPYKIQISLDYMKRAETKNPGEPVLVFSDIETVDEHLNIVDDGNTLKQMIYREKPYENFSRLLRRNCVSGCAEMINRSAWSNMGDYSESVEFYDHWTALIASGIGGGDNSHSHEPDTA